MDNLNQKVKPLTAVLVIALVIVGIVAITGISAVSGQGQSAGIFDIFRRSSSVSISSSTSTPSVNYPPVWQVMGTQVVNEGSLLIVKPKATDPNGDPITYYFYNMAKMPSTSQVVSMNNSTGVLRIDLNVLINSDQLIVGAVVMRVCDNKAACSDLSIDVLIKNEPSPIAGLFNPPSGSGIWYVYNTSSTTPATSTPPQISVLVNSSGGGIAEIGMYYRRLGTNDPLQPLKIVNDPIKHPEYSTSTFASGIKVIFQVPPREALIKGVDYDFEIWVKDWEMQSWWSGWGGGYVLYKQRFNW